MRWVYVRAVVKFPEDRFYMDPGSISFNHLILDADTEDQAYALGMTLEPRIQKDHPEQGFVANNYVIRLE